MFFQNSNWKLRFNKYISGLNVNDVLGKLKSANTKEPSGIDINVKNYLN